GGFREGEVHYIDVTSYVKKLQQTNTVSSVAFKIFTTSIVSTPISFASNEANNVEDRPQLLFYDQQRYPIFTYDIHQTASIETERGVYSGEVMEQHVHTEDRRIRHLLKNNVKTVVNFNICI
ncbi:MAG: hypothetical protein AAF316_13510, partial [Cyanobacteria bacterium P01_A01_bin.80]